MAKNPKMGGPFVAAAVLCNSVSEDSDGALSAMRIVDEIRGVIPHDAPSDFPSQAKPVELSLFALIMIRRGDARVGKHKLRLVMEPPSGGATEMVKQDIELLKPPNGASAARLKLTMKLHTAGLFWIDVFLGPQRLTRMALNVVIQRMAAPTQ